MKIEKILQFPAKPGVYWMKGVLGEILYVGKAKNLKNRVRAYFRKEEKARYQIDFLMRKTREMEYLVTDTEKEALLLEETLIKKHQPRYNIFFKDDKSYASLKLNAHHPFPGIFVTRRIVRDGSLYFGPYVSAGALRHTVDLLTRHFKIRTCSDHEFSNRSRPCLKYQIGRCSAPCVGKVSGKEYAGQIDEAKLFLGGKGDLLTRKLKEKMQSASRDLRYEEAARIRDLLSEVGKTLEGQKMVHHQGKDYDVIAFTPFGLKILFFLLIVRDGVLLDRQRFIFPQPAQIRGDFLVHFILQHYGVVLEIPNRIYIPLPIEGRVPLEEILKERGGRSVAVRLPKRGEAKKMQEMAMKNAAQWAATHVKRDVDVTSRLKACLGMSQPPKIIECVDISNLQGKDAVGSLVCFEEGQPLKSRYRKFKIRQEEGPNDVAMIREVLSRRFFRFLKGVTPKEKEKWSPPDLLLVDGGKGQLNIARNVLADLGIHSLFVAAIAKARGEEVSDKIYIPGRKNPLSMKPHSPELLYLMRIRDEAHRFTIAYHRKLRTVL